jgi:ABC-2 type transport system ATP-binding protein
MEEYIKIPIKKYSLGMKQKLIIGMYLISDATYLIMDEITNGLDDQNRKRFFEILKEWKKRNKTILLSSHYKDEISEFCDIVLQIRDKKLKEVNV